MFQAPHQELCRQFSVPRGLTKDKNEQNKRSPSSQVFEHTDLESMSNGGLMVGIGQQWILCGRLHVGPVCPPPPSLSAKHTRFFKKKKTLSDAFKMISSFRISLSSERLCELSENSRVLFHHLSSILTCQFTAVQSAGQRGEAPSL